MWWQGWGEDPSAEGHMEPAQSSLLMLFRPWYACSDYWRMRAGWFTATEAGAVGIVYAVIIGTLYREPNDEMFGIPR